MQEQTTDKPARWAAERATAFEDPSVVERYHLRPPYPQAVLDTLADLAAIAPRTVLDVGAGAGELSRRLVGQVERLDAVDRSAAMIARGRTLPGGDHPRLRWLLGPVETARLAPPYALVMGDSSLHWLDWAVAFPRLDALLSPAGVIAIVRRHASAPWQEELRALERRYAPRGTRDEPGSRPDVVAELARRGLFREQGRSEGPGMPFAQTIEDYVGTLHSRSTFSLDRMASADAAAFDEAVRALVRPWASAGMLELQVTGSVVWGRL